MAKIRDILAEKGQLPAKSIIHGRTGAQNNRNGFKMRQPLAEHAHGTNKSLQQKPNLLVETNKDNFIAQVTTKFNKIAELMREHKVDLNFKLKVDTLQKREISGKTEYVLTNEDSNNREIPAPQLIIAPGSTTITLANVINSYFQYEKTSTQLSISKRFEILEADLNSYCFALKENNSGQNDEVITAEIIAIENLINLLKELSKDTSDVKLSLPNYRKTNKKISITIPANVIKKIALRHQEAVQPLIEFLGKLEEALTTKNLEDTIEEQMQNNNAKRNLNKLKIDDIARAIRKAVNGETKIIKNSDDSLNLEISMMYSIDNENGSQNQKTIIIPMVIERKTISEKNNNGNNQDMVVFDICIKTAYERR